MRVCLISSYPPQQTGTGTYSCYLVAELSRHATVDVLRWNYKSFFAKLLSPLTNRKGLQNALMNYDVVHVQYHLGDFQLFFLPLLFILRKRAKVVLTLHEDYTNLVLFPIINLFHNMFYRLADLLILHTSLQAETLSEYNKKRSMVIPHGIIYREAKRKPTQGTGVTHRS
jgi:hypothetical protein